MAYTSYTHDPDSTLDYQWDWSDWLPDGDTITAATVTIINTDAADETPATVDSSSFTDTTVTAWISGGNTAFSPYTAVCHVSTLALREDDRSITLKVKER